MTAYGFEQFLKIVAVYFLGLTLAFLPMERLEKWIFNSSPYWHEYINSLIAIIIFLVILLISENLNRIRENIKICFLFLASFICSFLWLGLAAFKSIISNTWLIDITMIHCISAFFLVLAYRISNSAYFCLINKNMQNTSGGDDPKQEIRQDFLNRSVIAYRVFDGIKNGPSNWSTRYGICGTWGEGKTSLMNFIKELCQKEGYYVVWFNPWLYKNKEDLWSGFRSELEIGIIKNNKDGYIPSFWFLLMSFCQIAFKMKIAQFTLGKAIDELIASAGSNRQNDLKQNVNLLLQRYVENGKKIVVFIDDLDRVEDCKMTLDLLKGIKEVVNLQGLTYIIGFDQNIVSEILEKELPKDSGKEFLEKIIDFRIDMPSASDDEFSEFINCEADKVSQYDVSKDMLKEIKGILSQNPRKFKRYLRSLVILQPTLSQFNIEELDLRLLYIAQMISMEFPEVSKKIVLNESLHHFFTAKGLLEKDLLVGRQAKADKKEIEKNEKEEIAQALIKDHAKCHPEDKERLFALVKSFQNNVNHWNSSASTLEVQFYFRLVETRSQLSDKNFTAYFEKAKADIFSINSINNEQLGEYFIKLINYKRFLLGKAKGCIEIPSVGYILRDIDKIDKQIEHLIKNKQESLNELMKVRVFAEMFSIVVAMVDGFFENEWPSMISSAKNHIVEFIDSNTKMVLVLKTEMMNATFNNPYTRQNSQLQQFVDDIREKMLPFELTIVFNSFEQENGLKNLLAKNDERKKLLLEKSQFYNTPNYKKLRSLAAQAQYNAVIRDNLREYFIQLMYCTVNVELNINGVETLLRNKGLLNLLNQTYNIVPLCKTVESEYKKYFARLKKIGIDVEAVAYKRKSLQLRRPSIM